MAKVSMEPKGRFGMLFAAAVQKKEVSLTDLARKTDLTYEHMRKLYCGVASPSKYLIKDLCKILDIDPVDAEKAAAGDRMERRYGKAGFSVMGRDPRLMDIEDLLPQLSKQEWDMFASQIRGFVSQKRKSK